MEYMLVFIQHCKTLNSKGSEPFWAPYLYKLVSRAALPDTAVGHDDGTVCICAVQDGSCCPHVALGHMKCYI